MAYIQFENTAIQRYHNDAYMPEGYVVDTIAENGVAQVKKEVADALVQNVETISYYETKE